MVRPLRRRAPQGHDHVCGYFLFIFFQFFPFPPFFKLTAAASRAKVDLRQFPCDSCLATVLSQQFPCDSSLATVPCEFHRKSRFARLVAATSREVEGKMITKKGQQLKNVLWTNKIGNRHAAAESRKKIGLAFCALALAIKSLLPLSLSSSI